MSLASSQAALASLPADLPMQPHQLESVFWDWMMPVLVVLLATAFAMAAGRAVALIKGEEAHSPRQSLRYFLRGALQALVYVGILSTALLLGREMGQGKAVETALRIGFAVALLWAGFVVFDAFERHLYDRFHRQGRPSAFTVIPLLDKVAKGAWAMLITLLFLENMGMDVKALLAGLGVGGLAVALAGQKTMENLFGGLVLVLDQPVRVGDVCGFGDKTGEVVEVGLRSIKLRTDDRTIITVPNGQFSQLSLENFAQRDSIRFSAILSLRLDTGAGRLQAILKALEDALAADTRIDGGLARRVRFIQVSAFSLDVEVFCYFRGSDWEAFLLWRQALLIALLAAVEAQGGRLAFPTQTSVSETPPPQA